MVDWKSKYLAMKLKYINTKLKGGIKLCEKCNSNPTYTKEDDLCEKCKILKDLKNKLSPDPSKKLFIYLNSSALGNMKNNPKSLINLEEFTENLYVQYFYDYRDADDYENIEEYKNELKEAFYDTINNSEYWLDKKRIQIIDYIQVDKNLPHQLIKEEFTGRHGNRTWTYYEYYYIINDIKHRVLYEKIPTSYGHIEVINPISIFEPDENGVLQENRNHYIEIDSEDRILWDNAYERLILVEANDLKNAEDILSKYNNRYIRKFKNIYGADVDKVFNPKANNEDEET